MEMLRQRMDFVPATMATTSRGHNHSASARGRAYDNARFHGLPLRWESPGSPTSPRAHACPTSISQA
jgi:hypothetical protein